VATFSSNNTQGINEIRTYTLDFTNDLAVGGTVTGGTATHTPPGEGTAITPTVSIVSPYVYVTLGAINTVGVHYLDVLATFSDGDKSAVRLAINGVYPTPTARAGMQDILIQLRAMCNAGISDYTIAGIPYWSDAQLQTVLDRHRTDIFQRELSVVDELLGGAYNYTHYSIGDTYLESGANFYLFDENYNQITTGFTVDYILGLVTFTASTNGLPRYATYRTYDINAAASEVWRSKAAHFAEMVNFRAGNQSVNLSDKVKQALQMADYYGNLRQIRSISLERSDTC